MSVYDQLIATDRYVASDPPNISLRMKSSKEPRSIKEAEFEYIKNLIINNGLKRGYEIATGFGISALAAGLGFKETGGRLVTMDCYIEENSADYKAGAGDDKTLYPESEGFKSVKYLIETFGLENVIFPKIGWSPDDTEKSVMEEFPDLRQRPLDYIFVDGAHFARSVKRDIESIISFTAPGTYILLHDVSEGNFGKGFPNMIRKLTGKDYNIVVPYPTGFNMAVIEL